MSSFKQLKDTTKIWSKTKGDVVPVPLWTEQSDNPVQGLSPFQSE